MGVKPTQCRCASEALLGRFHTKGTLPGLQPLVDLCNAALLAFAISLPVFDLDRVSGDLELRHATERGIKESVGGGAEHHDPGEAIFSDEAGHAHARRWANRQRGRSAVRDRTNRALIVAQALHPTAAEDVARPAAELRMIVVALPSSAAVEKRRVA